MEDCKMLMYQVIECSTDFKPCKKCKLPKLHLKYELTSVAVATMTVSACKDLTLGYVLSLEHSCSCHYLYKCFGIDNNHSKPHPENPSQSILWSVTTNTRTSACDSWPFNRVFSPSTCARRCRSPNTSAVLAWAEVTMVAEFLKETTGQITWCFATSLGRCSRSKTLHLRWAWEALDHPCHSSCQQSKRK